MLIQQLQNSSEDDPKELLDGMMEVVLANRATKTNSNPSFAQMVGHHT